MEIAAIGEMAKMINALKYNKKTFNGEENQPRKKSEMPSEKCAKIEEIQKYKLKEN